MAKKQPKDYNKPKYDRQTEKRRDLSEMVEQPEDSRYTEQQIEDYCSDMENVHVSSRFDLEGVQIIRQLQEELRESFIVKRRYVDVMWEMPQGDINASVEQLQGLVQELLEKEAAKPPPNQR